MNAKDDAASHAHLPPIASDSRHSADFRRLGFGLLSCIYTYKPAALHRLCFRRAHDHHGQLPVSQLRPQRQPAPSDYWILAQSLLRHCLGGSILALFPPLWTESQTLSTVIPIDIARIIPGIFGAQLFPFLNSCHPLPFMHLRETRWQPSIRARAAQKPWLRPT